MQKVLRSTSTAILSAAALIALAACGDKVEVVNPVTPTPHITSVTVSGPTSYQLTTLPNDSLSYAATVGADANFTASRAVTWTSSNPSVFRITSSSGAGKALAAGSTVITATSTVDGVTGQLALTVTAAPPVVVSPPASVVISQIAQGANVCGLGTGGNVDLGNACGQLDVAVDVSYTTANRPSTIEMRLTPAGAAAGSGAVCDSRAFGGTNASEADLDVSTIVLSCRTAAFDTTTGATTFKNGQYTLEVKGTTAGSTTSSTAAQTQITLNNPDFLRASITGTTVSGGRTVASVLAGGALWRGGDVNTKVLPVVYTAGRTVSSLTVNLVNGGGNAASKAAAAAGGSLAAGVVPAQNPLTATAIAACTGVLATQTVATTGTVTFTATATGAVPASSAQGVLADTMIVTASALDQNGNGLTLVRNVDLSAQTLPAGCGAGTFSSSVTSGNFTRLDNQKPQQSWMTFASAPPPQGATVSGNTAWLGSAFVFNGTTAAGTVVGADADAFGNVGTNSNTVTFQFAPAGTAATSASWTTITATTGITPTPDATTYAIRVLTKDQIGNTDTSVFSITAQAAAGVLAGAPATFGVDLTPPVATVIAGPPLVAQNVYGIGQVPAGYGTFTITANDPQNPTNNVAGSGFGPSFFFVSVQRRGPSNNTLTCVTGSGTSCTPVAQASASIPLPTTSGEYTVTWFVRDQAGNVTPTSTFRYYIDLAAPLASTNGVALPASITNGTTLTSTGASDNMDINSGSGALNYPGAGVVLAVPGTATPSSGANDGATLLAGDISVTFTNFYRSLSTTIGTIGGKPDQIGIRAVDAASNLGTAEVVALPAVNISAPTTAPYTAANLTSFVVNSLTPGTVSNGTGALPRSTVAVARAQAPSGVTASPFTQVCFYYQVPAGGGGVNAYSPAKAAAGELVLINCTSTVVVTTDLANNRFFDYTSAAFDPDAFFGTAGSINIYAIGNNANLDALITAPVALNLAN